MRNYICEMCFVCNQLIVRMLGDVVNCYSCISLDGSVTLENR
jgi:hypothetical protein